MELVITNNNIFYQVDFFEMSLGMSHKMGLMGSNTFGKPWVQQVSLLHDFLRVFKILIIIVNIQGVKSPKPTWSISGDYEVHLGNFGQHFKRGCESFFNTVIERNHAMNNLDILVYFFVLITDVYRKNIHLFDTGSFLYICFKEIIINVHKFICKNVCHTIVDSSKKL